MNEAGANIKPSKFKPVLYADLMQAILITNTVLKLDVTLEETLQVVLIKNKNPKICKIRFVLWWILHCCYGYSQHAIGKCLQYDRTTVEHGITKITDQEDTIEGAILTNRIQELFNSFKSDTKDK
jgi:hypothetical protein